MSSNLNGIALGTVAAGSVLLYAAVTGKSVLKSVQFIVSGSSPALLPVSYPISGVDTTNVAATQSLQTGVPGGVASPSAYQQYAFLQFANYGWGTDQEQPLITLWTNESGWNPDAVNPSSGAAGIPQDITGNMHGGWQGQIDWGLSYIKGRYGTPAAALAFWEAQSPHWY